MYKCHRRVSARGQQFWSHRQSVSRETGSLWHIVIFFSFQTTSQDDKNFFLFSHLSRTYIPLYMHTYVHPSFLQFILYQLTGWSSQCVWWWGKLLGLLCKRRWQSKQKATKLPSSVGLPGLCMEPLLLWGRRKSKSFRLAERNPDPHCSCIALEN